MQNTPLDKLPELLPLYVGKQYVVDEVNDKTGRLLAVRRVWRTSPSDVMTSALYYSIDGTLYAAPTLASVLHARMQRALAHVHAALRTLQRFTTFSVLDAYKWNSSLSDPDESLQTEDSQHSTADDENSAIATLARARYFGRERALALSLLDELKRHRELQSSSANASQKRSREDDLPGRHAKRPRLDNEQ